MAKISWHRGVMALAVVPLLALAACSSSGGKTESASNGGGGQVADTPRLKIALITHAAAGDTFWDIVRKGAEEAAAKDNVEICSTPLTPRAGARPSSSSRPSTRRWTASR